MFEWGSKRVSRETNTAPCLGSADLSFQWHMFEDGGEWLEIIRLELKEPAETQHPLTDRFCSLATVCMHADTYFSERTVSGTSVPSSLQTRHKNNSKVKY